LGFGVLVVVIEGSVKAAKDGEDSTNTMMTVSEENNDIASTTHVNTSANESPRDEQNFEKRCV
jgi:hypothetical protein